MEELHTEGFYISVNINVTYRMIVACDRAIDTTLRQSTRSICCKSHFHTGAQLFLLYDNPERVPNKKSHHNYFSVRQAPT